MPRSSSTKSIRIGLIIADWTGLRQVLRLHFGNVGKYYIQLVTFQLPIHQRVMPGTLAGLPVSNRPKVGTTSSHHGLYAQGLTRATMAATERCEDRQVEQIAKRSPQFGLQADNSPA
ncbi:MAG: hypothetical protein GY845_17845 [Planctomycetes bacterium]|nr:hypothetical protein [Planctomycetota bacterium]